MGGRPTCVPNRGSCLAAERNQNAIGWNPWSRKTSILNARPPDLDCAREKHDNRRIDWPLELHPARSERRLCHLHTQLAPERRCEVQSRSLSDFARDGLSVAPRDTNIRLPGSSSSAGAVEAVFFGRRPARVMWLLNTDTLKLEPFYEEEVPKYAILSHRWIKKQEASFGDLVEASEQLEGHRKIKGFCRKARDEHYDYVWADTCCVDQKSSAELGEAINSMYKWYANAGVCYVYLADVDDEVDLEKSSWFHRGWTLQELLAPSKLKFFDSGWRFIGLRQDLARRLETLTAIPQKALQHFHAREYCVAVKMSWAANRKTSREEDRAYCLLGMFDVNMPLLYGEGSKAFQRLQEEIMRSSTDSSLFLWQGPCCSSFGMLAAEPSCFSKIPAVLDQEHTQTMYRIPEGWTYNNAGLTMTGMIRPYLLTVDGEAVFILFLHKPFVSGSGRLGIFIQEEREFRSVRHYRRVAIDDETWISSAPGSDMDLVNSLTFESSLQQLFITRDALTRHCSRGTCSFTVNFKSSHDFICTARRLPPGGRGGMLKDWPSLVTATQGSLGCVFDVDRTFAMGLLGHILVQIVDDVDVLVCLGLDHSFRPICIIIPFCGHIYHEKLSAYAVMRMYYDLLRGDEDADYAFDPALHVVALRGTDGALEYSTQLGVDLDIWGSDSSEFAASIDFNADVFLERSLPRAYTSGFDERGRLGDDDRQGLIERHAAVSESRRGCLWLS